MLVKSVIHVPVVCVSSKGSLDCATAQVTTPQIIPPAASENQRISTPDIRAKTASDSLPQHTASATVSSQPTTTATKIHFVASRESPSSDHQNSPAALSRLPDCPQSTTGTCADPQKVSIGGDEAKGLSQTNGSSAGSEGGTDVKEHLQSNPSSRGNERRSSRERERDKLHSSDWSRERERHYRDRSQERESDSDRYRYRREYRDHQYHHRSYRDRVPPQDRYYRDWEPERRWERTSHHPRERDRDRCTHHYHHYHQHRSREDRDREWRGQGYPYREESHSRWRWQQDSRESRGIKDKSNGREREYYPSKETYQPNTMPETSTRSRGTPPRAPLSKFGSDHNREDQNHTGNGVNHGEMNDSSELRHNKKHKKSKKKKKSKDKDRNLESG